MMLNHKMVVVLKNSLPLMLKGAFVTIEVAVFAMLIGFSIGLIFGIINSNRIRIPVISQIIDLYVLIIRGTPIYVQVLIIYFALPDFFEINLSPFVAGVVALGCNSIAYVSEIIRGGINSVPISQWEASYTLGYSFFKTLISIILPQMLRHNIPTLTSELVMLIKETSILAAIGLLELTRVGMNINARTLQPIPIYATIGLFYFILTTIITVISKKFERTFYK